METRSRGPNPEFVNQLFGNIAPTYDLANDVITFGLARGWRNQLVRWSDVQSGQKILDCATGTGDLAIAFKRVVGKNGQVIGTDFCPGMLEFAPQKASKLGQNVQFEQADVMQLPYDDQQFDVASIAYGIRNVSDPAKALSEMARVCRPGGKVMILETGKTRHPVLAKIIHLYFNHIVPFLGGMISGNRSAYEYLNQSSSSFPCREDFVSLMNSTGAFKKVEYKSLMGGASFIYKGTVQG